MLDFSLTSTLWYESLTKMGFTFTTCLRRAGSKGLVDVRTIKPRLNSCSSVAYMFLLLVLSEGGISLSVSFCSVCRAASACEKRLPVDKVQ